jgi:hypothetical protein
MFPMQGVLSTALLLAPACDAVASQPADTTPSHSFVYVEHDIPGIYRGELRAADLNGDKKPDLVLYGVIDNFNQLWGPTEDGKASARVMVYFNASTGPGEIRFTPGPVWKPGDGKCKCLDERWCGELQTFDYDGDGDTDFVISGKGLVVFTNDGKGRFEPARISRDGGHLAVGDFNGDGRDDVMHTSGYYGKGREFYLSFQGGKWVPCGFRFEHNMGAGDLVAGDLDGDGWTDVVVGGNTEQFGTHRASTKCFSQWHRNRRGRIDPDPAFFFSTLGKEKRHNTEHDGMDNGSYDLADLNRDGHLDVVFSGSHAGFQGNWDAPYWVTPENPTGARKWIHYDFFTLVQQPPFDGRHWKAWEFNGGGAGCKRTSCVNAADLTGEGYPEVVHIGHASQRLLPPPFDLPRRRADGFDGARRSPKGKNYYYAKYTPTIRTFENDGRGGLRFVYHETLIPVDYGNVVLVDLDGDGRRDLVYCGCTRQFHTNCSDFLDRNKRGETIHTLIYRNVPRTEPRLVISPAVESVAVGRQRQFRVIYHDGTGRSQDVTDAAAVACTNNHARASAGKVRGGSLGSSLLVASYRGLKAHSLFHVFEHPMKPLRNQWDIEHSGGCYLSVSPSSIALVRGGTRDGFVVTLHKEDGSTEVVSPTRVVACQPHLAAFSEGRVTALEAGPAALDFVYRLAAGEGTDLHAVCYVSVLRSK